MKPRVGGSHQGCDQQTSVLVSQKRVFLHAVASLSTRNRENSLPVCFFNLLLLEPVKQQNTKFDLNFCCCRIITISQDYYIEFHNPIQTFAEPNLPKCLCYTVVF